MLMCFEVVLAHYWTNRSNGWFLVFEKMIVLAVPVFMLISFMLTRKKIILGDKLYLKNRLIRLLYPSFIWACIYYCIYYFVGFLFQIKTVNGISDLLWQLVTGHCPRLNPAMWYIIVLCILTTLFWIIFRVMTEKKAVILISILMGISLIIQYSGINWKVFSSMRYELAAPLGRIAEMLPYAAIGFLISYFDGIKFCEKNPGRVIGFTIIIFCFIQYAPQAKGFGYEGVENIIYAVMILMLTMILPWQKFSDKASKVLRIISRYTLGIFCMHNLIGKILSEVLTRLEISVDSFFICILIYVICYIIAWIFTLIPCGWLRKIVE